MIDCLKKKLSISLPLFLSFLLIFFGSSSLAHATFSSVSLNPSTGTIWGTSTAISVYVNSGTDNFSGVDINLAYTGDVEYISGTGASICTSFLITEGTGTLNIECLSLTSEDPYNGVIATLYLKTMSTASGSSVFTFTSVDPETTTTTGATYVLSLEDNPNSGGSANTNTNDGTVPNTGLFDNSRNAMIFGVFLLLIGLSWNKINDLAYNTLGKVKENKIKRSEKRLENKRKGWERKF